MGLYSARAHRTIGDEPTASTTWREYVVALSAATDPGAAGCAGHAVGLGIGGLPEDRLTGLVHERAGSAVRALEDALRSVRRRARRAVGLADTLQLECEAARLRLLLIQLYMRLDEVDRAGVLARESQALL
jgi:hypothetical protein